MRAILESYDGELGSTEYSPQLSKRLKEAEDVLQRTQNHNVEMEVRAPPPSRRSACIDTVHQQGRDRKSFLLASASVTFPPICPPPPIQAELSRAQEEAGALKLQLQKVSLSKILV